MSGIDRLIWDRLAAYGMPAHHAAGILGNFVQESGLRPDIENGIGAYGLGQWLGPRRKALEDYASKQGRNASDPELQTDFLIHELNGSESKAARALQAAKTPGEAAAIFRRAYERPGEAEANDERRISAANKLFQKLSPIGTAYADEFPRSGPGTGWQETNPDYAQQFNPADYGLVPDETPTADDERAMFDKVTAEQQFDPAEYGLVPDDNPAVDGQRTTMEPQPSQSWLDNFGTAGDFTSSGAGSIGRQIAGITEGLQGAGRAMGMADNPAFADMPLLSPDKMKLLGATLKRDSQMGEAGAIAGDLAPFLAMSPAFGVAYSAAATPGDMGDRATAAGLSAAGAGVGSGLARMIRGFTPSAAAQTLMGEGVTPTVGQGIEQGVLGRGIRRLEEATTSLPLAGATTRSARSKPVEQWTNAVFGRAEGEIMPGLTITAGGKQGNEGILALRQSFNNAYDTVLQGQTTTLDPQVGAAIDKLLNDPRLYTTPEKRQWASNFVADHITALDPQGGIVPAGGLKKAGDAIAAKGASLQGSDAEIDREIGRALIEAESIISDHIESSLPPQMQGLMSEIDKRYANFKRIQRASAMTKDPHGHFSADELRRSVRTLDTSRDKARFAEGGALLQDLASAGKAVLSDTLGESGTAPRLQVSKALQGGELGLAAYLGQLPGYAALTGGMYAGSREPIQRALLGGYGWQQPVSEWASGWTPQVGAGLGYDFGN